MAARPSNAALLLLPPAGSPNGTLRYTEASDLVVISGSEIESGTLALTEAADAVVISGTVLNPVTGTLALTEAHDVVVASGAEKMSGTLSALESGDSAVIAGAERFSGTLATTDAADAVVVAGIVAPPVTGTLVGQEARDIVVASGALSNPVVGTLAFMNGSDAATFALTAIELIYTFEPPAHEEPMRTDVKPMRYFRLTYASSIIRIGGVLKQMRTPTAELIAAAGVEGVDFFRGGCVYQVSGVTAAELTSLGYSVNSH